MNDTNDAGEYAHDIDTENDIDEHEQNTPNASTYAEITNMSERNGENELQQNSNDVGVSSGNELQSNADNENDVKNGLATVEMDADDENAINDLFGGQENDSVEADEDNAPVDLIANISLEHNEKAEANNGKIIVTKTLDDSLEMVYTYGEQPRPLAPLYNVKINDVISANFPFKENVSET